MLKNVYMQLDTNQDPNFNEFFRDAAFAMVCPFLCLKSVVLDLVLPLPKRFRILAALHNLLDDTWWKDDVWVS